MSFRTDLKAFLDAQGALADLVGNRIRPSVGATKDAAPYINYTTIANPGMFHTGGVTDLTTESIQFDCWAKDPSTSFEVGEQLRICLNGFRGEMGSTFIQGSFLKNESDSNTPPEDGSQKFYCRRILVFNFTYVRIDSKSVNYFIDDAETIQYYIDDSETIPLEVVL